MNSAGKRHQCKTVYSYGLFQVGHRDLEDILKDIDLNGDGRVDFEGKTSLFINICSSDVYTLIYTHIYGFFYSELCWIVLCMITTIVTVKLES